MITGTLPESTKDALLILLVHGSPNPVSTRILNDQCQRLKSRCAIGDVTPVYLGGTRDLKSTVEQASQDTIIIVPYMVSEGYSTSTLIPSILSTIEKKSIYVCPSIGTDFLFSKAISNSLLDFLKTEKLPLKDTGILLVSHGTKKHSGNHKQSDMLRDAIHAATNVLTTKNIFIEEPPFLETWQNMKMPTNIIVVPHMTTTGRHSLADIPNAFGLADNETVKVSISQQQFYGPHHQGHHKIWLSPIPGTLQAMDEIIFNMLKA